MRTVCADATQGSRGDDKEKPPLQSHSNSLYNLTGNLPLFSEFTQNDFGEIVEYSNETFGMINFVGRANFWAKGERKDPLKDRMIEHVHYSSPARGLVVTLIRSD